MSLVFTGRIIVDVFIQDEKRISDLQKFFIDALLFYDNVVH